MDSASDKWGAYPICTNFLAQSAYPCLFSIVFACVEGILRRQILEPWLSAMLAEAIGIALVLLAGFVIATQFINDDSYLRRSAIPQSTNDRRR